MLTNCPMFLRSSLNLGSLAIVELILLLCFFSVFFCLLCLETVFCLFCGEGGGGVFDKLETDFYLGCGYLEGTFRWSVW